MICSVRRPERSSDGFGGMGPAGRILRYGLPGTSRMASSRSTSPSSTEVKPTSLVSPKNSWIRGLRRSQPTRMISWPAAAIVYARSAQTVVLPSAAAGEVMSSDLMGSSSDMNCSDVRSARNASDGGDFGCSAAMSSGVLRSSHSQMSGMSPMAGRARGDLLELGATAELVVERLAQQGDRDADREAGEHARGARRSCGFGESGTRVPGRRDWSTKRSVPGWKARR